MVSDGRLPESTDDPIATDSLWVTVLMPVYNGERFVSQAIDSILAQTYPWFEFLIINDGSTDSTASILNDYASRDSRIRVIHQSNIDQPATLNRGLREASHDWVAIIDHDDISRPQRLERQVLAVQQSPEVRAVGTYGYEITADGTFLGEMAFGPTTVREYAARRSRNAWMSFIHASVLMHRPTILTLGGYREAFGSAADSDLWSRVADRHPIIVVPEYLVDYRVHLNSMSFKRFFEQQRTVRWISACQEARRSGNPEPTLEELAIAERGPLYIGRFNLQRYDWMMFCLRRRRLLRREGKAVRAAAYFMLAAVLDPVRATRRILGRMSRHDELPLRQTTPAPR
ncbi:MAG TPA: glycosyltransferase [Thermomicrobiales bacterium]|nr:glycosyltransferase [Thermomicrobiales bacterium]